VEKVARISRIFTLTVNAAIVFDDPQGLTRGSSPRRRKRLFGGKAVLRIAVLSPGKPE